MNVRFLTHCDLSSITQASSKHVASFLCHISDNSDRPASQLKCALAAIRCLSDALDYPSPGANSDVKTLVRALTKTGTVKPAVRTSIMPLKPFHDLFDGWPVNEELPLDRLRLKAVTLAAITFMARPSDLAPRGVQFDPVTCAISGQVLSVNNIVFNKDGTMTVRFFATKNDSTRTGFEVCVPPSREPQVDPVQCLHVYIDRTQSVRLADGAPLFLSLRQPFGAIGSATIAQILNRAIDLAGLDKTMYSAKNFRPSAATAAVASEVPIETAMQLGRWKTREVFLNHYVYPRAPADYTSQLLSGQSDT